MAICTNCGANLPEGAQVCGACGAPVQPAQPVYGYRRQAQRAQQVYGVQPEGEPRQDYGARQGYTPAQGYGAQPGGSPADVEITPGPRAGVKDKILGFFSRLKNIKNLKGNTLALRILSAVFALGLVFLAFGIGPGIFASRSFNESEYASRSGATKAVITRYLRAGTSPDALRNAKKEEARLDAKRNYEEFKWEKTAKTENNDAAREEMEKTLKKAKDATGGFNWFLLQTGLNSSLFIWLGLIFAAGAGGAWWYLGGRIDTLKQNAFMPVIYGAAGFFVLMFFLSLVFAPVYFARYYNDLRGITGLFN